MTKQEFFNACAYFDWYYEMSDDHRVWQKGVEREDELKAIANQNGWTAIWQAWRDHMYTGDPWGTEKRPEPVMADFENL